MAVISVTKKTKMADLIHYRIRVVTNDNRQLIGELLAFDKHMNLVLSETEEYRLTKKSSIELKIAAAENKLAEVTPVEEKRSLGLVILRGDQVISLTVEAPPASDAAARARVLQPGPGVMKPVTPKARPAAPGLAGPVRTGGFGGVPGGFRAPPGFGGR